MTITAQSDPEVLQDAFFLDLGIALRTARKQIRVEETPAVTGLQVCWYLGEKIKDAPENLIHVPQEPEAALELFTNTRLRFPQEIIFPPGLDQQMKVQLTNEFRMLLKEAFQRRHAAELELFERAKMTQPEGRPLRIWCPASRLTTVLQYASKGLAAAFERLGYESRLFIEENEMQRHDNTWIYRDYCEFAPHIVININQRWNDWLHPDVVNATWWQDNMQEVIEGRTLHWRERDLVYAASDQLGEFLTQTGARAVKYQSFCLDEDIFCADPNVERENKLVFVGSSYITNIHDDKCWAAVERFRQLAADGIPIDAAVVADVAAKCTIPEPAAMMALNFIVRDQTVEWLCQQDRIPVEVYGRFWDRNRIVAPHYRGEVAHGPDLAAIYRSARYAYSGISLQVSTQRLGEIGACGCIPVVYDFRHCADQPHWDEQCLFFRSRDELYACLDQDPAPDADAFRDYYSYTRFARRILNDSGLGVHA